MHKTYRMSKVVGALFPERYRYLPYNRWINLTLRSLHILSFSVLTGGHYFNQPVAMLLPWLYAVLVTGGLMVAVELYGSFTFLIELRGLSVLLKILLLAMIPWYWEFRFYFLVAIIMLASVTSHMQGKYRHISIISPALIARLREGQS